jgi:hypothetical protein
MRIDLHGVFLITGETVPLEPTLRRAIERWLPSALRNATDRASHVTVTLADAFGLGGEACKQCELVARWAGDRRLNVRGVGRTFREAVVSCVKTAAHLTAGATSPDPEGPSDGKAARPRGRGPRLWQPVRIGMFTDRHPPVFVTAT